MHTALLGNLLWATSCLLLAFLNFVLYTKRLFRRMPVFTTWVTVVLLQAVGLTLGDKFLNPGGYAVAYWIGHCSDVLLQILVAYEFANQAFKRGPGWVPGIKVLYTSCAACAVLLSSLLSFFASPAVQADKDAFFTRFELFSSLLILLLSVSTLSLAYKTGTLWQKLDFARFRGFLLWSILSSGMDAMHLYWRTASHFSEVELIHFILNNSVLAYWCITLRYPSRDRLHADKTTLTTLVQLYRG